MRGKAHIKEKVMEKLLGKIVSLVRSFMFVCFFAVLILLVVMLNLFVMYLIPGTATLLGHYLIGTVMVGFSVVLLWLGIVEVFKKYI